MPRPMCRSVGTGDRPDRAAEEPELETCNPRLNLTMIPNEKLTLLAPDLTRDFPRSPRETLAGYVVAARTLDKCRAVNIKLVDLKFKSEVQRE